MADAPPGYEDGAEPDVSGNEEIPGDVDEPDLSLKTPGLKTDDKPDNLVVELADPTDSINRDMYSSDVTFEDLGLSKELLEGIYNEMGFKKPSGIQAQTLPLILNPPYRPLIAQGHNGCGKTTCFTLAMLSKCALRLTWKISRVSQVASPPEPWMWRGRCACVNKIPTIDVTALAELYVPVCRVDPGDDCPQAICMCPTRELVVQNLAVLRKMGKRTGITSVGVNEIRVSRSMPPVKEQVVIGTAGKVTNLISSRKLALDRIRILVFDEADEMMKVDGFKDTSVRMIQQVRKVSEGTQVLLFSATFDESIKSYCTKIMPNANRVFVAKEQLSLDVIKQYRVDVNSNEEKDTVLQEYILKNADRLGQTIIFVASRRTAQALYESMLRMGAKCLKLSGDMQPEARDQAVLDFRAVHAKILIATDVIARGFDVSTVTLVINYDLPLDRTTHKPAFDTYLHRIGRSGRFGRKGAAFNFVNTAQRNLAMPDTDIIDEISKYFNREIPSVNAHDEDAFIEVLEEAGLTEKA